MRTGETDTTLIRIGPLKCVDTNGDAVIGESFGGAGEAELSINDGAFSALTTETVEEIGDGYYYLQGIAANAATRGFVAFKLSGPCVETTFREDVEDEPDGIPVGTADADDLHIGPIAVFDTDGVALSSVAGITVETSINGSAWAAAAGVLSMTPENGYADYVPHATDVAAEGWIVVKVTGTCREFAIRQTITASADADAPVESVVSPAEGTIPGDFDDATVTPLIVEVDESNLATLIVFCEMESKPDQTFCVYRRGSFVAPFDAYSSVSTLGSVTTLQVRHNAGWPPGDVTLRFDAVDTSGNLSDP